MGAGTEGGKGDGGGWVGGGPAGGGRGQSALRSCTADSATPPVPLSPPSPTLSAE